MHVTQRPSITDPIAAAPGADWTVLPWDFAALDAALVWEAGIAASREEASRGADDLVKVICDGTLLWKPDDWPGAHEADRDPERWRTRVAGPDATAVLFYARGLQQHHRRLYEVLLEGLAPRLTGFGLPRGDVESEMFYGHYTVTPGGIHREGCSNQHLVLAGRKFMHMWRGDDWIPAGTRVRRDEEPLQGTLEHYLPELDPREVLPLGTRLTASAGQCFFWHSGIWHVGESPEPSLSINIASYTGSFDDATTGLALPGGPRGEVPADWPARYRDFAGLGPEHDDARVLARASALGMKGAAPDAAPPAGAPARVRVRSAAPLLWLSADRGLHVATHGAVRAFPSAVRGWLQGVAAAAPGDELPVPAGAADCARWLTGQSLLTAAG
ncbi:hypothetical protein ACFCX4_02705 [Kitasatospora sp. NPDC056327]|uniref:hypothetical protein n=1 Tax=Kitasatospora sp. NPDC056327 TaxID=3345785 RepID=UPI0035DD0A5A